MLGSFIDSGMWVNVELGGFCGGLMLYIPSVCIMEAGKLLNVPFLC